MKSVGLLGMRDDLIRRCLFHPDAAAWDKVSALSQVTPPSSGLSLTSFGVDFAVVGFVCLCYPTSAC